MGHGENITAEQTNLCKWGFILMTVGIIANIMMFIPQDMLKKIGGATSGIQGCASFIWLIFVCCSVYSDAGAACGLEGIKAEFPYQEDWQSQYNTLWWYATLLLVSFILMCVMASCVVVCVLGLIGGAAAGAGAGVNHK